MSSLVAMEITRESNQSRDALVRRLKAGVELASRDPHPKMLGLRDHFNKIPLAIWSEVLEMAAPTSPKADTLLMALEKNVGKKKIVWLAAELDIATYELTDWVQTWYEHINRLVSAEEVYYVIRDIAKDARNHEEPCGKCEGTGDTEKGKCGKCSGTGKVEVQGDRYARRMLLEMRGLVSGPKNNMMINVNTGAQPEIRDLIKIANSAMNRAEELREKHAEREGFMEAEVVE